MTPRSNNERLVGFLFDAFEDLDVVVGGLEVDQLMHLPIDGSRFAWTYAHVTNQLDGWINVRFQTADPDPVLGSVYSMGGSGRPAHSWNEIEEAVRRVRHMATTHLAGPIQPNVDARIPYNGSFIHLREAGLHIAHAILRIAAHHYVHIGEIVAVRKRLGHEVAEPPGLLKRTV